MILAGTYKPCDLVKPRCVSGTGCRVLVSKRGCALRYFVYAKPRALYSVTHPERNLKIEYIYRTKLRQHTCRGEQRSPDKPCVIRTTYVNNVCYPQQHLCFHKPCRGRRPRRPDPSTFRIALLFIPQTMTTPTYIWDSLFLRKIAPLFAYLRFAMG